MALRILNFVVSKKLKVADIWSYKSFGEMPEQFMRIESFVIEIKKLRMYYQS